MIRDKETLIKSLVLALATAISAFASGMLLNYLLKSINIGFWILFVILFLLLFEVIFLCLVILIGRFRYFIDLNNRIIKTIKKTSSDSLEINKTEKERLKDIINIKKDSKGEN